MGGKIVFVTGRVAYPVDISVEPAAVVDYFLTRAFILRRSEARKIIMPHFREDGDH